MSHNGSTNAWRTPGKAEAFAGPPAPAGPEPEVDERFEVLVDAPRWAVVAKSGNLPCHPGGRYRRHTLERLLEERAGFPSVHFVSRLDRETSGCVLVAKDPDAAGAFGKAMMARRLRKAYLCLVRGAWTEPAGPDGWTDAFGWIRPAGDAVVHKYRVFTRALSEEAWRSGDPSTAAHTRFRPAPWSLLSPDPQPPGWTLLECVPVTGRTHQIRATLLGLGLEVGGDKLYGPDYAIYGRLCEGRLTDDDRRALLLPRQALHAWKLSFRDPFSGADVEAVAPPTLPIPPSFPIAFRRPFR